jgi:hypothetical protein
MSDNAAALSSSITWNQVISDFVGVVHITDEPMFIIHEHNSNELYPPLRCSVVSTKDSLMEAKATAWDLHNALNCISEHYLSYTISKFVKGEMCGYCKIPRKGGPYDC